MKVNPGTSGLAQNFISKFKTMMFARKIKSFGIAQMASCCQNEY